MDNERKTKRQGAGVYISGGSVSAGGDIVGGDKVTHGDNVTIGDVSQGAAVATGRGASANVIQPSDIAAAMKQWKSDIETKIDVQPDLSAEDRKDLKEHVAKIQTEAAKGKEADPGRLEKLINTLGVMGPDIFEVSVTTLANPLGGIGLVLKKIGDKVKLEREAKTL